jgi:hypothetical protein
MPTNNAFLDAALNFGAQYLYQGQRYCYLALDADTGLLSILIKSWKKRHNMKSSAESAQQPGVISCMTHLLRPK